MSIDIKILSEYNHIHYIGHSHHYTDISGALTHHYNNISDALKELSDTCIKSAESFKSLGQALKKLCYKPKRFISLKDYLRKNKINKK